MKHESFDEYRIALHCACSVKSAYFQRYGIFTSDEYWPSPGLPAFILGDNGPLTYNLSDQLTTELGITTETSTHYRADHKGFVECRFRIINLYLKPYIRGVIDAKQKANGGKNPAVEACLTRKELMQIVVDFCGVYNRTHPIQMSLSRGMLMDETLEYNPLSLYRHGLLYRGSSIRPVDPYTVNVRLLHKDKGTLSRYGLKVNSLTYTSSWALNNGLFTRRKNLFGSGNTQRKMDVYIDSNLADTVFTYDSKSGEITVWTLSEELTSPLIGVSRQEAADYLALHRKRLQLQTEKNRAARAGLITRIKKIVSRAARLTRKNMKAYAGADAVSKKAAAGEELKLTNPLDLNVLYGADPYALIRELLNVLDPVQNRSEDLSAPSGESAVISEADSDRSQPEVGTARL